MSAPVEVMLELDGPLAEFVGCLREIGLSDAAIGRLFVAEIVRTVRRDERVDARRRMNAGHGYGRPRQPHYKPRYDKRRNIVRPARLWHSDLLT